MPPALVELTLLSTKLGSGRTRRHELVLETRDDFVVSLDLDYVTID